MNSGNMTLSEKPDMKGHTVYNPGHRKHPEKANPERQKGDYWLPRGVGAKIDLGVWVCLCHNENVLKLTVMMAVQLCKWV